MKPVMRIAPALALASSLLLPGCGGDEPLVSKPVVDAAALPDGAGTATDAATSGDGPAIEPESPLPAACANDTAVPPRTLACTGLYAAIETKQIANRVRAFSPAVPLWSDGADKARWIYLPPGTQIDNTNPNEWLFPVGTKAWKEFSHAGRRVETRLWQKVRDNFWVKATYAWDADETVAVVSPGGDVTLPDGATYHIPTSDECQQCHRGRTDRLLGFEHVSLGLPGATGVTLRDLVAQDRLTVPPQTTALVIGDDGTGAAGAPLAWMHINCGTTCHNPNSNAVAYAAGMNLRLDPRTLDGRSALQFDALTTTLGVSGKSATWNGRTRIVPGNAAGSVLYQLVSSRGIANQMPPIATRIPDDVNDALLADWINKMPTPVAPPPEPGLDAGVPDGVADASAQDAPVIVDPPDAGAADEGADVPSVDDADPDDVD